MDLEFSGELIYWRGPAPWHFVVVPDQQAADIQAVSRFVTYGWGVIPVDAHIGATSWQTSMFPRDGAYLVPVKAWVRKAESLELGDTVAMRLSIAGA